VEDGEGGEGGYLADSISRLSSAVSISVSSSSSSHWVCVALAKTKGRKESRKKAH
jgi:hypothetical protein